MALYQHRYLGHTAAGENWMFTWWADSQRSLAASQTAAEQWAADLWAGAVAGEGFEDHTTAAVGLDSVTTVEINEATGVQVSRADGAVSLDGVVAALPLPSDLSVVVSLRTSTPTRSGRGRFYLPQVTVEDVTSAGRMTTALTDDLTASLAAAWGTYNTGTDTPVVYSRTQRTTRDIVSFDIGDLFDTQRGREGSLVEARTSLSMP